MSDIRDICAEYDFLPVGSGRVCRGYETDTGKCVLNNRLCPYRNLEEEESRDLRERWKKACKNHGQQQEHNL